MALETVIRDSNTPKDAGFIAVEHLVTVKPREKNPREDHVGTEIELKTDLSNEMVMVHTAGDFIGMLSMIKDKDDFRDMNVLQILIERKERKLLSLDRKSRLEVVDVARPQTNGNDQQAQSFIRRMFSPRP
jgi:hypothetical protein